jgi:hypothetical protein
MMVFFDLKELISDKRTRKMVESTVFSLPTRVFIFLNIEFNFNETES